VKHLGELVPNLILLDIMLKLSSSIMLGYGLSYTLRVTLAKDTDRFGDGTRRITISFSIWSANIIELIQPQQSYDHGDIDLFWMRMLDELKRKLYIATIIMIWMMAFPKCETYRLFPADLQSMQDQSLLLLYFLHHDAEFEIGILTMVHLPIKSYYIVFDQSEYKLSHDLNANLCIYVMFKSSFRIVCSETGR